MSHQNSRKEAASERRPSLEQKIRRLVRSYRAAERRRQRKKSKSTRGHRPPRNLCWLIGLALNLLPLAIMAAAVSPNPDFDQALAASATGHYDQAARIYSRILTEQGYSAPVLYNLGNTFYHQGQWGRAILNYERALWLVPHDADAAANLRLAQGQAGVPVAIPAPWETLVHLFSANTIAWIGSAALLMFALSWLVHRRVQPVWGRGLRAVRVCLCAVVLLASADLVYWWTRLDRAVILSADTPAHVAPAAAADVSFSLNEGQIVDAGKAHGDFRLVRTADGRSGWVNRNRAALIVSE